MKHPIRTLHIIDRLDKRQGGSVTAVLDIAKFLAQRGEQVEVVGSTGDSDDLSHLAEEYSVLKIHRFQKSFPQRYAHSATFNRWLRDALPEYDLVEIHAIFSSITWNAARICKEAKKPYFVRPHGSLDPFDLKKHALLKKVVGPILIRPMLAGASAVLLTAPLESERLVTYGANVRKIVMPLPVFLPGRIEDRKTFRAKHKIPTDACVILFLSRLDYKKGLEFLIPALGKLKTEYPALWFVLAGSGAPEFTKKVRALQSQYGINSITSEVGFLSGQDKLDAFAAANVFVLPSLNENFGIVNIEAMHSGLPLLISDEVYICREIEAAGAGLVCQPNIESVTHKLRELLGGTIDLKQMGERGRELVQRRYRPEAATEALLDLYTQTHALQ
jgi:glycosyltransferase involved in cell wall biosynthesis